MKTDEAVKVLDEMTEACLRIDSTSGEALAWKSVRRAVNSHDDLVKALEVSMQALNDWLHIYASDMCNEERVQEARNRVLEHGTLAYISEVTAQISAALKKAKE